MEQRNSKKRKRPEQNLGEPRRRRRGLDSFFSYLESLMENLPEDARRDLQERLLQIVLDAVRRHQALSPPPGILPVSARSSDQRWHISRIFLKSDAMAALLSSAMAENKSKEVTRSTCDGEPSHSEASQSQRNVQDISQTETVKHEDIRIESGLKIPQQHTRLDLLLSQIPKKAQHGLLMQCDLILTCIDANDSYIALGTNIGLTFLYNRNDNSVQRLKSETSNEVITCIKLHHGVDHQLAVGMASGAVCIFLIPGYISVFKKQLQKFEVQSVHRHYVTCVEWSTNGMKLFSGDKTGNVVCTEVDFYQGQCKSVVLLVEPPTEIVQLHYDHKVLVVSTRSRSFVCRLDTNCQLVQIGQQDRKVQGSFGACFIPGLCKTDDAKLYAVRPGCRIWLSDIHGTVCNTFMFKEKINAGMKEIPLLQPSKAVGAALTQDFQFGRIYIYREKQVVTFNPMMLFILNPEQNCVVAGQNRFGGIVDIAINKNEIFVLRRHTDDEVIRIAEDPEIIRAIPSTVPFDPPLSNPVTSEISAQLQISTTRRPAETLKPSRTEENSSPKNFFKKNVFNPLKKLENLIQEQRHPKNAEHAEKTESALTKVVQSTALQGSGAVDSSPDLPPIVSLDSPDLAVRVFTGGLESKALEDIQSPDSAHSALSVFGDELGDSCPDERTNTPPAGTDIRVCVSKAENSKEQVGKSETGFEHTVPIAERVALSADQWKADDDIVFSHKSKKKKIKKKKLKGKGLDIDTDTASQASYNSQLSEESSITITEDGSGHSTCTSNPSEFTEIIRRADEALSSVDRLLKSKEEHDSAITSETKLEITARDALPVSNSSELVMLDELAFQSLKIGEASIPPDQGEDKLIETVYNAKDEETAKEDCVDGVKNLSSESTCRPTNLQLPDEQLDVKSATKPPEDTATHEDLLKAAERTLMDMKKKSRSFHAPREDSADDFYSMFNPYTPSESVDLPDFFPSEPSPNLAPESTEAVQVIPSTTAESDKNISEATLYRLANNWSEFTASANIYSLALSGTHIWFTDKSDNLYYSAIGEMKGVLWRKVGDPASQIAVSPSGHIVWRLHKGRVFAGTKITHRRPEGLKWVEAVRDVRFISVDDHCAWYIKTNGEVMMQRGLSKERPCFRSLSVEIPQAVKHVIARYGVVWAITESLTLMVRVGITDDTPQGTDWLVVKREMEPSFFFNASIDNEGIGWAVDVIGQIWFTDQVTPSNPAGSGNWWQVPLSKYFIQDPTTLDIIRSIARKFDPQKLSHILSYNRGGLIVAGVQGLWVSLEFQNTLHVCRGSVQGYCWSPAQPKQMAVATVWRQVQASIAHVQWGVVWAQQVNGELFVMSPNSQDAILIPSKEFVSMAVNELSVWGLTAGGDVYVRSGVGPHCPHGTEWLPLDLTQLGNACLVHLSCNSSFVWSVDSEGQVFHRIGASAPRPGHLNPVWLPIDTFSEIIFTKVFCGPVDWMVWAIDNRRLTYVRFGITENLPLGVEWVHVPGIQAMDLTLTSSGVWALNTNGEMFYRFGITRDNISGNYWKKTPGMFIKISASADDTLWAINTSGQIVKCSTRFLFRRQDSSDPLLQRSTSVGSEEGDWELV